MPTLQAYPNVASAASVEEHSVHLHDSDFSAISILNQETHFIKTLPDD